MPESTAAQPDEEARAVVRPRERTRLVRADCVTLNPRGELGHDREVVPDYGRRVSTG